MALPNGYVDLQVNGYGGVDFNADELSPQAMHAACQRLREDGVDGILATIITERLDVMCRRLARLAQLRSDDQLVADVVWGIHIEGPFINQQPGYVGAHPAEAVMPADCDAMRRLLDAAAGLTRLVTLAPERDAQLQVTRMLADDGIVVAAGHCDPTLPQLRAALDAGLSMFTHLGNGCPMTLHRHDNIVQRVLSLAGRLWISFIADGAHVPLPALGNYLRAAGIERSLIVSDAVSAAGCGPGTYRLGSQEVVIGEDLICWAPDRSHFVGSATTMRRSEQNLQAHLGLSDHDIARLTKHHPRAVLTGTAAGG